MNKSSLYAARSSLTLAIVAFLFLPTIHAQDPGFFLDNWQEKSANIPAFQITNKTEIDPSVNIHVDMSEVLNRVPMYVYGNNAVTWGGNMNEHATVMTDINNLNPHVLRWPGGNLSQEYFWNLPSSQPPDDIPPDMNARYGVNDDWQMSTYDYYDLLANTNSTGIISVNYSYARYGTGPDPVAKAAHLAAQWVRFDKGRSKFWEIGNENFGNWEAGYKIDVSLNQDGQPEYINGQLYGQHCKVFIDSMRAAAAETGADIKIGVVAYDAENSWDPIQTVWNEGMMPEVGDLADYLIVHSYFTPHNENSTVSTILNSHHVPADIMSDVVDDMAEAGKPMIPVAMTEWNIFAKGSMQQVSYINGMHSALVLGELIKNDYGLATRWDLTNAWNEGDDHGMFSRAGEPGVDQFNPRPVFFYMKYFQDYFGDRMVNSTVTGNNAVIAYASSFSSGEAGFVIINKSASAETALLEIDNFEPGLRYFSHTLTGGTDNGDFSRKVFLNGYGTTEEGGGPDDYETVRAFSYEVEGGIEMDLPPLSVVYLMVDKKHFGYVSSRIDSSASMISVEFSEALILPENPTGFEVFANGSEALSISGIEADSENGSRIYIFLDRDVLPEDTITLDYSGTDIISSEGTVLAPFSNVLVDNLLPGSNPELVSAEVSNDGFSIEVLFSKPMNDLSSYSSLFTIKVNDEFYAIDAIHSQDSGMTITPATYFRFVDQVSLSYDGTGVSSVDGGTLQPIEDFPVLNSLPEPHVFEIPGMIDAELFSINMGMVLEPCKDDGGGFDLGHIDPGDWVEYEVNVTKTGYYNGNLRVSALFYTGQLLIQTPDGDILNQDTVNTPVTGGAQIWKSIPVEVFLQEGRQRLRLTALTDGFNINWLDLQLDETVHANFVSAVTNETGDTIEIVFDKELADPEEGEHTGFKVLADGNEINVTRLALNNDVKTTLMLALSAELSPGNENITVSYESGSLMAADQSPVAFFSNMTVTNQVTTNVELLQIPNLSFYPNPAHDHIYIKSDGPNISGVEIVGLSGERLRLKELHSPKQSVELELELAPGVYLLKIKSKNNIYSSTLIVN